MMLPALLASTRMVTSQAITLPYLYNFTNSPDKTQYYVSKILARAIQRAA
jgi:putative alpha-1,2-mannosidase